MKCGNCKWWDQHSFSGTLQGDIGFCRRFPPTQRKIHKDTKKGEGGLVDVFEDDWCGEFKAKV